VRQREAEAAAQGVLERREELRQRFALTRLRNYYRDVRQLTTTSWPPEQADSTSRPKAGEPDAEGGVHVNFYDADHQIRTPRPVVGTALGGAVRITAC
jgi:hypothetical protein